MPCIVYWLPHVKRFALPVSPTSGLRSTFYRERRPDKIEDNVQLISIAQRFQSMYLWFQEDRASLLTLNSIEKRQSNHCNRSWRSIGLWDIEAPTFFYTIGSQMPAAFYVKEISGYISVRGWVDRRAIVWLKELGQLRYSVISSGIDPVTFRLVTWYLNQLHYRLPQMK
jgi:hypothetical protein